MLKKIILGSFALLLALAATAQTNYWQQEVNYRISVRLDDVKHELHGTEEVEYTNNSKDELTFIYFHLWPNAYKDNSTAFAKQKIKNGSSVFHFSKDEHRGYIDNLDFRIDSKELTVEYDEKNIDVCKLILNEPLKPGGKVTITTPFSVKIPYTFSRLGHVEQAYQITQWYPKPAVYDKNGWHPMPYLDMGEFYSEYGSFEVWITLPENYVVGATGVLQDEKELEWMEDRQRIEIKEGTFFDSAEEEKTLHYKQDNIHDFAWFADKHYNVKKGEVELPSGRRVTSWYLYHPPYNKSVNKAIQDLNDATFYYSKWVGEYPYDYVTAVTGPLGAGGGMEYPMITITDPSAIIHEVGHNWFYGILGTNERDFGWMDEGFNSFYEEKTKSKQKEGKPKTEFKLKIIDELSDYQHKLMVDFASSRNLGEAMEKHSNKFTQANYFFSLYVKPVVLLEHIEEYLGEELFEKCMHAYHEKWKFKHPYLEDFVNVFEETSDMEMDFVYDLVRTTKNPDVKIKSVKREGNKLQVTVKNTSGLPVPIKLSITDENRKTILNEWLPPIEGEQTMDFDLPEKAKYVVLNKDKDVFESNYNNNKSRISGPLKRLKGLTFHMAANKDSPYKCEVNYMPALGYNSLDGAMLGVGFYNYSLVKKRTQYLFMPMYGFKSEELKGIASLSHTFARSRPFQSARIGTTVSSFSDFTKVELNGQFQWRMNNTRHRVKLSTSYLDEGMSFNDRRYGFDRNLQDWRRDMKIHRAEYNFLYSNALIKLKATPRFESITHGGNVTSGILERETRWLPTINRVSMELKFKYKYARNTNVKARVFIGRQFRTDSTIFYGLSGSFDYARNNYFIDRAGINNNVNFLINQTDGQDGGFRAFNPILSSNLITAANFTFSIPKVPFNAYFDIADVDRRSTYQPIYYWGAGLGLNIVEDVFEFYVPLVGNNFINTTPSDFTEFGKAVRFKLSLQLRNPDDIIWDVI